MRLIRFRALILGMAWCSLILPNTDLLWARSPRRAPQGQQSQQSPPSQAAPQSAINVQSRNVGVDVIVTDNDGNYLNNLKKENFRVLEDGKIQEIVGFNKGDAPITMVMLMEFSNLWYGIYGYNAVNWGAEFLRNLKPNDWIALAHFDLKTSVDVDFTHNSGEVLDYLRQMMVPTWTEANLRDAVLETLDRLKDVKGKKSILLLASGFDTFSKHNLDQTMKELKQSDVTIFSVGLGQQLYMLGVSHLPMRLAYGNESYVQAQNELKTYAQLTGGQSWFPVFDGEIPDVFRQVAASLRNQYTLSYVPSDSSLDGKYHKIKVELVSAEGGPLVVTNEKGKKMKFVVYAREGYTAPKGGVGD